MNPDALVPWPDELVRTYRRAGCWRGRPLGSYLWEWAESWPDRVAVVDGPHRLTYRDLAAHADRLAYRLAQLGLARGDSVLLQLPNRWEFVAVTLACFRLGVAPAMMLPPHREYELTSIGRHVDARTVIVADTWRGYDHQALGHRVAAKLPGPARVLVVGDRVGPDSIDLRGLLARDDEDRESRAWLDDHAPSSSDVALFLLSGGTTGLPKLIGRTHDDYEYNLRCAARACGCGPDDVHLVVLPAGHNFPLANPGILGTLATGGRVVLLPSARPERVFETIEAERVTTTSAVPSIVLRWMEERPAHRRDLSSLRYVHVGGSPLAPDAAARIGPALGCRIQQVYGMAEGLVCYTPPDAPDAVAHATQGRPISPYDELRVLDPTGNPVRPGGIGELVTRGPYTLRGYYGAPAENAVSFTPDGWYRTGDLVQLTRDGNVVVRGRVKDLINRGGEKISAAEVETLVQTMPQIAEVAVVALPDPVVGERVGLYARVRPGHQVTLDDIRAALAALGVAAFKMPEHLSVVEDLPHTPVGKLDKAALRMRALDR